MGAPPEDPFGILAHESTMIYLSVMRPPTPVTKVWHWLCKWWREQPSKSDRNYDWYRYGTNAGSPRPKAGLVWLPSVRRVARCGSHVRHSLHSRLVRVLGLADI